MIHIDFTTGSLCPTAHTRQTHWSTPPPLYSSIPPPSVLLVFSLLFSPRNTSNGGNLKVHGCGHGVASAYASAYASATGIQTWAHQGGVEARGPRYRLYSWVSVGRVASG